jgi:hypothetical protein
MCNRFSNVLVCYDMLFCSFFMGYLSVEYIRKLGFWFLLNYSESLDQKGFSHLYIFVFLNFGSNYFRKWLRSFFSNYVLSYLHPIRKKKVKESADPSDRTILNYYQSGIVLFNDCLSRYLPYPPYQFLITSIWLRTFWMLLIRMHIGFTWPGLHIPKL